MKERMVDEFDPVLWVVRKLRGAGKPSA